MLNDEIVQSNIVIGHDKSVVTRREVWKYEGATKIIPHLKLFKFCKKC